MPDFKMSSKYAETEEELVMWNLHYWRTLRFRNTIPNGNGSQIFESFTPNKAFFTRPFFVYLKMIKIDLQGNLSEQDRSEEGEKNRKFTYEVMLGPVRFLIFDALIT
jgi:hypothetical protein